MNFYISILSPNSLKEGRAVQTYAGPRDKKTMPGPPTQGPTVLAPTSSPQIFFSAPHAPKNYYNQLCAREARAKNCYFREIRSKVPHDQRFKIDFLRLLNVPLFFFGARVCWDPLSLGTAGPLRGPGPGTNCPTCPPLCTPLGGVDPQGAPEER